MFVIDIALIIILIASAAIGYIRGLVNELMRIFVWVGSIFGSYYVYFYHTDLLPKNKPPPHNYLAFYMLSHCFEINTNTSRHIFKKNVY